MKTAKRILEAFENGGALLAVVVITLLPFAEWIVRFVFGGGIHSSSGYLTHSVIVLTFFSAVITTRKKQHLGLGSADFAKGGFKTALGILNLLVSAAVTTSFTIASLSLVLIGFDSSVMIGFIPIKIFASVIPLGYLGMNLYFLIGNDLSKKLKPIGALGVLIGIFAAIPSIANCWETISGSSPEFIARLFDFYDLLSGPLYIPSVLILVASAMSGAPIFVALGGLAVVFFGHSGGVLEGIPSEAYEMLKGSTIPAIPLFTMTGYLLSEGNAGKRLVELFKSLFGWIPGGMIIVAVLVSTVFTTFTGATGITILALGGLLSYVLIHSKYSEDFSHGLLTASGSIGLLFPPSLVIIIYAITAQIDVIKLYLASILPGALLVLAMCLAGVFFAIRNKVPTERFSIRTAALSLKNSIFEILLPVIIMIGYFSGYASLSQTGAFSVLYVVIVECFILKEIPLKKIPEIILKSLAIVGGTLIILASARGLSFYIIDAEVPAMITGWVRGFIQSKFVFLLLVNLALLITGCFMDIFSAVLVVAPLLIPLGESFGVNPYHLAVIFIANMGIGFLTPPIGMNLFLASYTFKRPVTTFFRLIIPYFFIQLAIVLLITYVPWFSTVFLG